MKSTIYALVAVANISLLPTWADTVDLPKLAPVPRYADTEEIVDFPFKAFDGKRYLHRVEASFIAGEKSNFVLIFGVDDNGDGKLSMRERRLEVGYDCGRRFVRNWDERKDMAANKTAGRFYIDMYFDADNDGSLVLQSIQVDDAKFENVCGLAKNCKNWNICRIVGRGYPRPEECVNFAFLDMPPDAASALHLPNERPLFSNADLSSRFGYDNDTDSDDDGLSFTKVLKLESGAQTNSYAVKFAKWALKTPGFRRFEGTEKELKSLLGASLGADVLGYGKEPPKEGFVAEDEYNFTNKPEKPYRAFTEITATRAMSPTRIGMLTGSAHFKSAAEADAEAVAIAEDICTRFCLVPEVAVPGKAWIMQTPRIMIILARSVVNGEEAVALTIHDKQSTSIYISLSNPEQFAEED